MRSVVLAFVTVLLLASVPARAQETNPELGDTPHVYVTILQGKLKPDVQKLTPGDAVGWLNYTDKIARISFDKEVAKRMVCKKEGSFKLNGDRLESSNIQAQQFATLCVLSKGEYTYKVDLFSGAGSGGGNVPTTREGKLIVE
jgi:plastocyanin